MLKPGTALSNIRSVQCAGLPALAILLAAISTAGAQPINIDFGLDKGTPPRTYGAAADQAGVWNSLTGFEDEPTMLVDTNGDATSVSLVRSLPFGQATFSSPAVTGDDAALFNDYFDLHSVPCTFTYGGMRPGRYLIYNYAWPPDDDAFRTSIWIDDDDANAQIVGGPWPGGYVQGVTHALHEAIVGDDGQLVVHLFGLGKGTLNGQQFVPEEYHLSIAPEPDVPEPVMEGMPISITVRVSENDESVEQSPTLHYRATPDLPFFSEAMIPLGGGLWTASLPGFSCGESPQLYVSATGSLSGQHTWPPDGANSPRTLVVSSLNGDINADGATDGRDIAEFVAAAIAQSTDAFDLCRADFDGTGAIDPNDVPGFVASLIGS